MKASELRIPVRLGGLTFKNPFYVSSGPTTKSVRQLQRIEDTGWAAASIKLTIDPFPYINRKPRYGLFNHQHALGFTAEKRLTLREGLQIVEDAKRVLNDLILMANITYAGDDDLAGWVNMAKQFELAGVDIVELNMCCPNMSYNLEVSGSDDSQITKKTGASMGQQEDVAAEIAAAVVDAINIPLFVKLTPEGGNIAQVARALFTVGADAVGSTGNRVGIPPINLEQPASSSYHLQDEISISCYSSSWLKPLAQRDTYEIRKLNGPEPFITATGGITNWRDAVEMIMCGGNLLGICSETLINGYDIVRPMIQGLKDFMDQHNYQSLDDFRDRIVPEIKSSAEVTLHEGYARIIEPTLSAPCKAVCPHHVPVQAYVQEVVKGDFKHAFDLITAKNPLQDICGLVCSAPCEDACTLGKVSRPVEIRAIKRFVLEYGRQQGWPEGGLTSEANGHQVAVIGSGPAGLTCAVTLRKAGYAVTIFERESELGGNLRYGVPAFRLDRKRLDDELDRILAYGIDVQFGKELGRDIMLDSLESAGYESVFIAIGSHHDKLLNIPGENTKGVLQASALFKSVTEQQAVDLGGRVVVVGESYAALDAAQTALRLGADSVTLVSEGFSKRRGTLQKILQEAQEEGVQILEDVHLNQILTQEGKVSGVELVNSLGLTMQDACTTVILAGEPEVDGVIDDLEMHGGRIKIDRKTGATTRPGVYAGGDAVRAGTIISAISAGKRAAVSIDHYLRKEQATLTYPPDTVVVDTNQVLQRVGYLKDLSRSPATTVMGPEDRKKTFETFERVLTESEAIAEAGRCLNCGCGEGCQLCKTICCEFAPDIIAPDTLGIDPEQCVACGMCYLRCPLGNIEMVNTDKIES
jgi:NADPH-dependent glutamate synthase beta subunit-like oxidoreductase/dihydroorotate dehydrogenase/NAD-dependent dihydropyrimidine dehydrogenase PreA subunit